MTAKANQMLFDQTSSPDELRAGTKLLHGQYTIKDYLNSGGFGITYLAKDSLDRQVVIKECFASAFCRRTETIVAVRSRAHANEFNSIVRLFVQEAKNLAKLKHPNIVAVHQIFEDNDTAYMAMDYVNGRDLLDLIEDPNDSLTPNDIQALTLKLLSAIGYIHSTGVLHRDISPDNILVEHKSNNPILIDFGAAREDASAAPMVSSMMRLVKDGYSPQEFYIQGSEQTPSSDLYAFAATLYHLITGICPPDAQTRLAAVAAQRPDPFKGFVEPVKGYSKEYLDAINKAMQIFPYERLQSAREWMDIIRPGPELVALNGGATDAARVTPRRIVSKRLEDAQAEAAAGDSADADSAPEKEIEVIRANRPARPARAERAPMEFLNVSALEPAKKPSPVMPLLGGAVAACIVVGLGLYFFAPSPSQTGTGADASVDAPVAETPVAAVPVFEVPQAAAEAVAAAEPSIRIVETVAEATETPLIVLPTSETPQPPAEVAAVATPEAQVVLSEPELPQTIAPSIGSTIELGELTPDVISSINSQSAANAGFSAALPGVVFEPELPSVDVTAPDALVPTVVEADPAVPENAAVKDLWTVLLPFTAAPGAPATVGSAPAGAPEWIEPGVTIYMVNGRSIGAFTDIPQAIRETVNISGRPEIEVKVVYTAPGAPEPSTAQLVLPAVREVTLLNGMLFRSAYQDGKWVTSVAFSPNTNPNGLRTGDQVIAYIPTSEKLEAEDALATILGRELSQGVGRFAFAVNRDGGLWVASMLYNGQAN